ncbi:MAG: polysaccharide deacetylase family protein [Desulfitobacteriaceae bacterium]|nr:polysaccharide deacetylase family protein [Desulfitobacteriaceae bacterium]
MINTFLHEIQITGLAKEAPYYIKLKLTFATGEAKQIQFQIDRLTYQYLSKVVLPDFINQNNGAACFIPVRTEHYYEQFETEWVIWNYLEKESRFSFACSEEYKNFLNRLRKIESIEAFQAIISKKTEEPIPPAQLSRLKIPKFLPVALGFSAIMCLTAFTALSWQEPNNKTNNNYSNLYQSEDVLLDIPTLENKFVASAETTEISTATNETEEEKDDDLEAKAEIFMDIISSLPDGQVALTFDDGPSHYTEDFLAVLEEYDIPATFFFIGQNIQRFPEAVMAVQDKGHGIGLHSFNHQVLRDLTHEELEADIVSCLEVIEPYVEEVSLFRPPYGMYDDNTKSAVFDHGMSLVLWNRDPKDWDADSSRQIIESVLNTESSGGIYVMHETELTLKALPQIIERILAEGVEFVNLENMPTEQSLYKAADAEQKTVL